MRCIRYSVFIGIFSVLLGAGTVRGAGDLTVYAGATVYADPAYDSVALVEFPFSLTRNEFEFFHPTEADSSLFTRIFAQVDLINTVGLPVDSVSTYFSVSVADLEQAALPGIRLFNKLMLFAEPGIYSARLTVIDVVSKRTGTVFLDRVIVNPSSSDRIKIGGPQLAYQVTSVSGDHGANMRLVKNGFLVVPNPVGVYSAQDTVMEAYGEVYNLDAGGSPDGQFMLSFDVLDKEDSLYRSLGMITRDKPGATAAFGQSIDIKSWPPGAYRLRIVATDTDAGTSDTSISRFAIISPQEVAAATRQGETPADPYERLTLKEKMELVTWILEPQQLATLQRLSDEGKENFLRQYWSEHDSNPQTPVNEERAELIQRYRYANANFSLSEGENDGWQTALGRVYIKYGRPDEIDDRQAPRVGDRYQVWYYRAVKEGKVFVFIDERGNDDYRLVHSNVYGEVYDSDWADRLDAGWPDFTDDL